MTLVCDENRNGLKVDIGKLSCLNEFYVNNGISTVGGSEAYIIDICY